MKKKQISLLLHALSLFCFLLLFRLVFLILFYHSDYKQNSESLWPYLWLGAKFDLRLCLLVLLPLLPIYFTKSISLGISRKITLYYLGFTFSVLTLVYAFDFGHFSYLKLRLSSSILLFLENPKVSADMISESYSPLFYFFLLLFVIALYIGLTHLIHRLPLPSENFTRKRYSLLSRVFIFFSLGIYGQFSYYPLTWSQAFRTPNTSLFGNPLSTTPALKKATKKSLFYTNFYTSTTSIARSIFSSFVGMSDVSKVSKRYQ